MEELEEIKGETVTKRPGFAQAIISITLPVVLMLARAIAEIVMDEGNGVRKFLEFLGTPAVALLIAVLVSMWFLGYGSGMNKSQVEKSVGGALPAIAGAGDPLAGLMLGAPLRMARKAAFLTRCIMRPV